ncbi:EAL domain-containing protein [Pseudomonas aeruginosa]|nr:EAL domain-containing protein [Pseudomonas aeruginosa]
MEVVAEGVETPDCLAWLRQAGCDTVQGFLFARPMPAAAFVGFVNQWRNTGSCRDKGKLGHTRCN